MEGQNTNLFLWKIHQKQYDLPVMVHWPTQILPRLCAYRLIDRIFKVTTTDGAVVGGSNGEFRTDENGYISLPNLEPGGYVVQEIKAKEGYLLDNTPKTVQIKDHQTYTLEFFNQPVGGLVIKKMDSATKEPLSEVKPLGDSQKL